MSGPNVPAPVVRDVSRWSAHARMWRLTTERRGEGYQAVSCGARLEALEARAAREASRSADGSVMTFFCLPETMKAEAFLLDPASLLSPGSNDGSRRFIEHFGEYLEFLGSSPDLRARACVVAPAQVSRGIVRPFDEPGVAEGDTLVCCNLSDVPARIALRGKPLVADEPEPAESIALSLDAGDCLICARAWMLGYLPDENGEPTFWFECLVRSDGLSGARRAGAQRAPSRVSPDADASAPPARSL